MKIDIAESLIRSWLRHVEKCTVVETNWKAPSWQQNENPRALAWEDWFKDLKRGVILGENVETASEDVDPEEPAGIDRNTFEQFVSKAEIDALGLKFATDGQVSVKAVDVAFHRDGLGYNKGGKSDNRHRVAKKLLRSAIIVDKYFPNLDAEVIFATPKTRGREAEEILAAVKKVEAYLHAAGAVRITLRCIFDDKFKAEILDATIEKAASVADTSELFLRAVSLGALDLPARREATKARQEIPGGAQAVNHTNTPTVASVAQEAIRYLCEHLPNVSVEDINGFGLKSNPVFHRTNPQNTSYKRRNFPRIGEVWYNDQWKSEWDGNTATILINSFNQVAKDHNLQARMEPGRLVITIPSKEA